MAKRDFETEFDEIMVGEASRDEDLIAHFEFQMYGEGDSDPRIFGTILASDIEFRYVLNKKLLSRSVGQCVAKVAGIKTGREFFGE